MREALRAGQVGVDGVVGVVGAFRGCIVRGGSSCSRRTKSWPRPRAVRVRMPRPRPRRMSCARTRRCGPRIWIRTARNRPSRGRCASAGSRWGAAGTTGWSRCVATCCPRSPRNCSSASTVSSIPGSTRSPGRASPRASRAIVTNRSRARPSSALTRRSSTTRSRCCSRRPRHPVLCRPSAARRPPSSYRCGKKTSPRGRGYAHLPGDDEPISLAAARHIACTGAVQRVVSRRERPDRVDRDPRPCLQPPPAPRDHPPRRRMPHSRLSRSPAVVRDPSRRGAFAGWADAYRQRSPALLVPSSDDRLRRLAHPDDRRRPVRARPALVGRAGEMATRHEVPDPRRATRSRCGCDARAGAGVPRAYSGSDGCRSCGARCAGMNSATTSAMSAAAPAEDEREVNAGRRRHRHAARSRPSTWRAPRR